MVKLIIAGSRTIGFDPQTLKVIPEHLNVLSGAVAILGLECKISEIVSGCAFGADQLGEQWADNNGVPIKKFPANWREYGKSAGFRRNSEMADYGDRLLALWDGKSRGTANMVKAMIARGKPTQTIVLNGCCGLGSKNHQPGTAGFVRMGSD